MRLKEKTQKCGWGNGKNTWIIRRSHSLMIQSTNICFPTVIRLSHYVFFPCFEDARFHMRFCGFAHVMS